MLSVITPVLNGVHFIENNIRSVKELQIPYEHIIVDGGSNDGTLEIVKKYDHVRLLKQRVATGMYGAIDEGMHNATGNYVCWLNADDVFLPGLGELYRIAERKKADLVYGNAIFHYLANGRMKKSYAAQYLGFFLRNGFFGLCQSSSIFSKACYEKVGGFDFDAFKVCGDLDLYQKIAYLEDVEIIYVPVFASVFLMHDASLGSISPDRYKAEYQKLRCYKGKSYLIRIPAKIMRTVSALQSQFRF